MNPWLLPPNLLSLARILMTPVIAWHLAHGDIHAAFPWLVAASLTDLLDGQLARRFGWTSDLGQKLDPVADKLMLAAVYGSLSMGRLIPAWLACLVVGRDVIILAFAAWAARRMTLSGFTATRWGKLSTLIQMTFAGTVLGSGMWPQLGVSPALPPLIWVTAAATAVSGLGYARIGWLMIRSSAD